MSNFGWFENALVTSAIQGSLKQSYLKEGMKGTVAKIMTRPVKLEPRFQEYKLNDFATPKQIKPDLTPIYDDAKHNLVFLKIWFSPKDKYNKEVFENFWQEIFTVKQRLNSIIIINNDKITYLVGIDKAYLVTVQKAMKLCLSNCEFEILEDLLPYFSAGINQGYELYFKDYLPNQPYFKCLSEQDSSLPSFFAGAKNLQPPAFAFLQILCIGIGSEWRNNIINLLEAEHESGIYGSLDLKNHIAGYGLEDYRQGRTKIDATQKLGAVILRLGVVCKKAAKEILNNLTPALEKFTFGGVSFKHLTEKDYLKILGDKNRLIEMITKSISYHPGFILTSQEINQLWHPPAVELLGYHNFNKITGLKAPEYISTGNGIILGKNEYAGKETIIRQQSDKTLLILNNHMIIIGLTGSGKSTLIIRIALEHMEDE